MEGQGERREGDLGIYGLLRQLELACSLMAQNSRLNEMNQRPLADQTGTKLNVRLWIVIAMSTARLSGK